MTQCLLYCCFPTHIILALCAVMSRHNHERFRATLLIHHREPRPEINNATKRMINQIARQFPFIKRVIFLYRDEFSQILSSKDLPASFEKYKKVVGSFPVDEIYYAQDIGEILYEYLCIVYPRAKRIYYGDAFGTVMKHDVYFSFLESPFLLTELRKLKKNLLALLDKKKMVRQRKWIMWTRKENDTGNKPITLQDFYKRIFLPHQAVLILPVDQSGDFFPTVPLLICQKKLVVRVVKKFIHATNLRQFSHRLLARYRDRNKVLLLTEYHSDQKYISLKREVDMYCEILRQYVSPGSVVFIKSHPSELKRKADFIRKKLKNFVDVIPIKPHYCQYPIELWEDLVRSCRVISMSTPTLSLKYLYGTNVVQPMNKAFIEHWFPRWLWASYKNALSLYMEPLRRLDHWDGKSILWSGHAKRDLYFRNFLGN